MYVNAMVACINDDCDSDNTGNNNNHIFDINKFQALVFRYSRKKGNICHREAGREGRSVIEEQGEREDLSQRSRERGKSCHRGAGREGRSVIEEQGEREDLS